MDDAESMGLFQHIADLRCDFHRARRGEWSFTCECLRKSFAFDKLHHDEVTAVRKIARVEDHRRVRVAQLRHRARFAQEAIGDVGVTGKLTFDDLDCYRTFETQMRGEIDSAHATGPDFAFDPKSTGDKLGDIHMRPSFGLKAARSNG